MVSCNTPKNEVGVCAVLHSGRAFERCEVQYGKETRIARGKRKMEGKNIYLSVFPEFLELLSFCLLILTKTVDLQVIRVTIMLRITRLSLLTGCYKKLRLT